MAQHLRLPCNTENLSEYLLFALCIGVLCRPLICKKATNLVSFVKNESILDISVMFVALIFVWFHTFEIAIKQGWIYGGQGPRPLAVFIKTIYDLIYCIIIIICIIFVHLFNSQENSRGVKL